MFKGRPDLDRDDFTDYLGAAVEGATFTHEGTEWRIGATVRGEEGENDLLIFERVDAVER
jgi:hypothetical protein